jgi:hypothetical protein
LVFPDDTGLLLFAIIASLVYMVVLFWAIYDAFTRFEIGCAGGGCIWPLLMILFPPSILLYIFMRFYTSRTVSKSAVLEHQRQKAEAAKIPRFDSDIHKLRYLAAADKEHGTMYDPVTGAATSPEGYPHFADSRAEALLKQRRFDEAFEYLLDLHSVAASSHDVRARDTYRHYISRIPGGLNLLAEYEIKQSGTEPRSTPPDRRSMPF